MSKTTLYNCDCFEALPLIEDNTINLFLLDLPYGQTACKWDTIIDLEKMWKEIKRTLKPSGVVVMFCTTKFGYKLIQSNEKWFRYDLIWEKSRKVGFLSANKMPLRKHENIYIFNNKEDDTEIIRNIELRNYAEKVKNYIGKTTTEIMKEIGQGIDHFFRFKSSQFGLPIKDNYEKLTELYDLNDMEGFLKFDDMKELEELETYNPQKTEGKPYKTNGRDNVGCYRKGKQNHLYHGDPLDNKGDRHPTSILPEFETTHENIYIFKKEQGTYNPQKTEGKAYTATRQNADIYSETIENMPTINKGDRHPTSILPEFETTILKFNNPHKTIHRTQKPVDLLEWLIKTYSNEGDLVMDFCMGSGSCSLACFNTNRDFIGVEKDDDIYKLAFERIKQHKLKPL